MGSITGTRLDGSSYTKRVNSRTTKIRASHEQLVALDLSHMGQLPALTELSLAGLTPAGQNVYIDSPDLTALAELPALRDLSLGASGRLDLAPLGRCPALTDLALWIGGTEPLDLSGLAGHPRLTHLSLQLQDQTELALEVVRELPALAEIGVAGGEWRTLDLEPLRGRALTYVALTAQYIDAVDLSCVAQPALQRLLLEDLDCAEIDLSPLRDCPELCHLSLHGLELAWANLSPLARLRQLARIDLPNYKTLAVGTDVLPMVAPALLEIEPMLTIE